MILAIDSSGLTASTAILDTDRDEIIAEYTVNLKKTHSETLLPMIDELFGMTGLDKAGIAAVAVASGPGSFTGLRIGGAAAKGIAGALGVPVVPIPTTEGLAYNCYGYRGYVCPIMDARRGQTYTGIYEYVRVPARGEKDSKDGASEITDVTVYRYDLSCKLDRSAISIEELADKLNEYTVDTIFVGDGIPVFRDCLDRTLNIPHEYAPAGMNRQSAASIARLGVGYLEEGRCVGAADFAPEYLRQSQAEREAAEAASGSGKGEI